VATSLQPDLPPIVPMSDRFVPWVVNPGEDDVTLTDSGLLVIRRHSVRPRCDSK